MARDSGSVIVCRRSGIVDTVDARRIIVRVEAEDLETRTAPRLRRRHLPAHQVPPLQPEHLREPEADRVAGPAGRQGPGAGRRPQHGPRRAGARPQRAGRLHALARLQLRGRDRGVREAGQGGLLHLRAHRGAGDRRARHQARSRGDHARHPERLRVGAPRPRRRGHRPDRRPRSPGQHPGRQGDPEGRDPAHPGGEAAARDLRREGRRRSRCVAEVPAGHLRRGGGRQDLRPPWHREGHPGPGDRGRRDRAGSARTPTTSGGSSSRSATRSSQSCSKERR